MEQSPVVNGSANVVELAKVIIYAVAVDGKVAGVVDIAVPEGEDHPEGDEDAEETVERAVERNHERVGRVPKQNVPVKGRERVDAQAMVDAGDDVEVAVVGGDPGQPVEPRQGSEDVVGEPKPDKHGAKHEVEKLDARNLPLLAKGALDRGIGFVVKSLVEGNGDERSRPHAVRRIDEKAATDASHAVANKVCGQGNEELVGNVGCVRLIKVLGQILHPDDVVGVGRVVSHVCHDGDEHVLLLRERAGVEGVICAKESETDVWQPVFARLAHGVGQ